MTAVPDTGYEFVDWSDGIQTAERTDTNVTADLSVTANFARKSYTLTYTAGPNNWALATLCGNQRNAMNALQGRQTLQGSIQFNTTS